jgi:hypothetical protein
MLAPGSDQAVMLPSVPPDGHATRTVYLVPLGPEPGGWCEPCLLPSLVHVRVFQLIGHAPSGAGPIVSQFVVIEPCDEHEGQPRWVTP